MSIRWLIYFKYSIGGLQKQKIKEFFRILSICHDVIPERVDGKVKLSASNPDDEALVCAAKHFGYEFCDKREKFTILRNSELNTLEEVQVLETIEFTSARKKMSVIIRDYDGVVRLFTKGDLFPAFSLFFHHFTW